MQDTSVIENLDTLPAQLTIPTVLHQSVDLTIPIMEKYCQSDLEVTLGEKKLTKLLLTDSWLYLSLASYS